MAAKSYNLIFDGYWRAPSIGGLPPNSGIYAVYAGTFNAGQNTVSLRKLLYVGESENVRDRVVNHERWSDWQRSLSYGEELCFGAALISPASDRERAEAAVIHHHKPPLNTEHVDSFQFDDTTVAISGKSALLDAYFTVRRSAAYGATAWRW